MKKITLFFALLMVSIGFSQEVIQSFEAAGALNGGPFGGMTSATVVTDAGSNATQVLQIVANPAGEVWQGENLFLAKNVDLTTTKTMSMDVFSATPITFLVKVNGGVSGAPEAAAEVTHNGNSTWQTLNFTFNTSLDGKAATANGVYSAFVIHAYWAAGATTFSEVTKDTRTFYIDNIYGVGVEPVDLTPTVAAPTPPARAATDVISLFSNAYTDIAVTEWSTSWDSADISDLQIAGNDTKKINFGNFLGIELGSYLDLSSFTHMHFDYWIIDDLAPGQVLNPKLSNHAAEAGETSAIESTNAITTTGEWVSYDVALADFTIGGGGSADKNKIKQILFASAATFSEVYVDNIYFHKNTTLSTNSFSKTAFSLYPNPTQNSWTIQTQNVMIASVKVFDVLGKNVLSLKPNATESTIEGSSLKAGLYFAQIETASGISSLKLVKK